MFQHKSKHQQAGHSIFMGSVEGLANTAAVAATFFVTPPFYNWSVPFISRFASSQYGPDMAGFAAFAWFILSACLVFFTARASLATVMVMGGLAVATRLF